MAPLVLLCVAAFMLQATHTALAAGAEADLRQRMSLNRDWKFHLGDAGNAAQSAFSDAGWESVGLPHSFSMPYFMSKDFYVGYGWYRRHMNVPADYAGKRVNLEFEGAFQDAEVFVNGTPVGEH